MSKRATVDVQYSEDGMFGSDGPGEIDLEQSYAKFEAKLESAIGEVFPNADVQIANSINDSHSADWDPSSDDSIALGEIIHRVWESFDWIVE